MQPNQQGRTPDGGGQRQQLNQNQVRSQQVRRQVQNQNATVNIEERIDQMIYGYLRRHGYNNAADAMEDESKHIQQHTHHGSSGGSLNRATVYVNDRIHDQQIEDIIKDFLRDGRFGLNQNMLDFGDDLRRLADRFSTITANSDSMNRSYIHQQLYKQNAYSRHQQPQDYTTRPAPQAIAQMQLQRINQIAEVRYREEQRQRVQSMSAPMVPMVAQPIQDRQQIEEHPQPVFMQPEQVQQEIEMEEPSGSSRRKLNHPQNLNERIENALNPLVGFINERPQHLLDDGMDFGMNPALEHFEFPHEFIQAFHTDFDQDVMIHDPNDAQNDFNQVLNEVLNEDQQNFADPSLVVEEEVVIETERKVIEPVFAKTPTIYAPGPLLSPLPKNMDFRKGQETPSSSSYDPNQSAYVPRFRQQSFTIPKKSSAYEKVDERKRKDDDRKDKKSDERNSRSSSSPQWPRNSVEDQRRHRDRDSEKEKGNEKSTNRERDHRRDNNIPNSSSSNKHSHRASEAHHSSHIQSDRESTSSSSSRATVPDKKEDKERRRKEREQKAIDLEKEERRRRKEKEQQERDRSKNGSGTSSSGRYQQTNDLLNTLKSSHASGRQSDSSHRSSDSGSTKRKADEPVKRDFKIPKKTPSASPHPRSSHGGSSSHEPSSSNHSSKPGKSVSRHNSAELCQGDDRPDTTHFINPTSHSARISSILLNTDTSYQAFHDGLMQKSEKKSFPNPSPSYTADECSGPITPNDVPVTNHPKGKSFAPIKGSMMARKKRSSSSDTTPDGGSTPKTDGECEDSDSTKSRSQTPEKPIDPDKMHNMLDRIHSRS